MYNGFTKLFVNSLLLWKEGTEVKKQQGRYHNDYSPRYQERYDIYEKAKEHMKKKRKEDRLVRLPLVEQKHGDRSQDNDAIADKTKDVGNLAEEHKS